MGVHFFGLTRVWNLKARQIRTKNSDNPDKKGKENNPEKSIQIISIIYTIFPRNISDLNQNFKEYFEGGNLTQFSRESL